MKTNNCNRVMKRHLFILFIIFISAFLFLVVRIGLITAKGNEEYKQNVLFQYVNRQTHSEVIVPKRGTIMDRHGTVFAESIKVYNVIYDPGVLVRYDDEIISSTNQFLSDSLENVTVEQLSKLIQEKPNSHYELIGIKLDYDQIGAIQEAIKDKTIKGVFLQEYYKRVYPNNTMASDVIGFLNNTNEGTYGVEEYYNDYLKGTYGRLFGFVDDDLVNQEEIQSSNGDNILLTLDYSIQKYVEEAIVDFYEKHEANSVNVIVMNPNNGEIYAMASHPNFNLNEPYNLSENIEEDILSKMTLEEKYDERYKLWRNYNITDTYEPGSTYKALVLAAALEEGIIDENTTFNCTGSKQLYGIPIKCWKTSGHGEQNIYEALANSCNVAFMEIGEAIGKDIYYNYQHMFGFGAMTGIDLLGEENGAHVLYEYDEINPVELATGAFGQGFNITSIQLISAFSSIINGGYIYEPHIMKTIKDQDGIIVENNEPKIMRQIISKETSEKMIKMLINAVEEGTGKGAKIEGYQIGGKTGTAEKGDRDIKNYVVSFIGFAMQEKPEIVTLITIDEPIGENGEDPGGAFAVEVFKNIMEDVLPYKKIFPNLENE